jgi:iron complex outermembrane recepter protein
MTVNVRRLSLICTAWVCATALAGAPATPRLAVDIAPQPLNQALAAFGEQTGLQLFYVADIAKTRTSKGAGAGLAPVEALAALLEGTGLRFDFVTDRAVRIFEAPGASSTGPGGPTAASVRHARVGEDSPALAEVLVTANRRLEDASKVPINMVVWSQKDLQAAGIKGIDELASLTPSMQLAATTDVGPGALTLVAIRGVWDRSTSMIGLYLDDTPIPPIRGFSYVRSFPRTFDLERIEVLKGPQLQLFGAGNQAGAIRFISNEPSLSTFTAAAEGEIATTDHGAMSYYIGAASGGPLIRDVLGFRVSAWQRSEGGFVDRVDPFTATPVDRNANRVSDTSVRGALTLEPTQMVRIKASLTYASYSLHDTPVFWTPISNADQGQFRTGSLVREPLDDTFYLGAVNVMAGLGAMDFSAVTSYFHRNFDIVADYGVNYDWGSPLGGGYPVSYSDATSDLHGARQATFMQELRLSSADRNATLTWDAGAFYSNEQFRDEDRITGAQGLPGETPPGPIDFREVAVSTQDRLAAFGEVSLRVTKRLTLSAALRSERTHYNGVTEVVPHRSAGADSVTLPHFSLAYQASERDLIFLTAAKGYGTGGLQWISADPVPAATPQTTMDTDTLWSYELGTKSRFQDGRVQLDTGVFHITWNNSGPGYPIPFQGFNGHLGNPGAAASNGFDVTLTALAGAHLKTHLSLTYTDVRYTQTSAPGGSLVERKGDAVGQLPFVVSPWNVGATVEYSAALAPGATATLRVDDIFRSRNPGPFAAEDPSSVNYLPGVTPDPPTNLLNLRVTAQWASYTTSLFVNNVLNAHPILTRNSQSYGFPLFVADTFRPRTVGLSAMWRF